MILPNASVKPTGKKTQLQRLINLLGRFELFHQHDDDERVFAKFAEHGNSHTIPVESRRFRRQLMSIYHSTHSEYPSQAIVREAAELAAAIASSAPGGRDVCVRVGTLDGAHLLDLCDSEQHVVTISPSGYSLSKCPSAAFLRPPAMKSLPVPESGGTLDDFRRFFRGEVEHDFLLQIGWLLWSVLSKGPFPILALVGEYKSAKTTTAMMLRDLVDPNASPVRSTPSSERDFVISCTKSWVQIIDNVSSLDIRTWSDVLCRVAYGEGFSKRRLHSNDDEITFYVRRPLILTSIDDLTPRGDLLDRMLVVNLPQIVDCKTEHDLWSEFKTARPRMLGFLLNAVCGALRDMPHLAPMPWPRMADFMKFVTAAEPHLGLSSGAFHAAYRRQRQESHAAVLDSSNIGMAIAKLMANRPTWRGTALELLQTLAEYADDKSTRTLRWPCSPRAFSVQLRKIAPSLRGIGIEVNFRPTAQQRLIELYKMNSEPATRVSAPHSPHGPVFVPQTNMAGICRRDANDANDAKLVQLFSNLMSNSGEPHE